MQGIPGAFWVAATGDLDSDNYSRTGFAKERFQLLLSHESRRKTGSNIIITEAVLVSAAGSQYNGRETVKFLLERGRELEFVHGIATHRMLEAASKNDVCGPAIVEMLLKKEKKDSRARITESVIAAAMGNRSEGKQILKLLCKRSMEAQHLYVSMGGKLKDLESV